MSAADAPPDRRDLFPTAADLPHFVLKRGHKGRFRFAMGCAAGILRGEVFVEPSERETEVRQARALIDRLAVTLRDRARDDD